MAVNLSANNSQIISPTIAQANQAWYASILYKADHTPNTSNYSAVFGWEDAGAAHRRRLCWDDHSTPDTAFMASGAGTITTSIGSTNATTQYNNYLITCDGTGMVAYNNGVQIGTAGIAYILGSAQIYLGLDVYGSFGDISPKGLFSDFVIGEGAILQTGEIQYLGQGGWGGSIRPGTIVEFLPLQSDTLDHGPNAYTQTVSGSSSFVADPPQLLSTLPPLLTPNKIRMTAFRGNEQTYQIIALDATDDTGTDFRFRPTYASPASGGTNVHDPSITQVRGRAYVTNIIPGGVASSFSLWQFAADQYTLNLVATPSTAAVTGTGANARTFKPRIFVDPNSSNINILVGLSNNGFTSMQLYLMTPISFPTTWNNPVQVTGTGLPAFVYDACMIYDGGTYYICCTTAPSTYPLTVLSSSSVGSGYTVLKSGNWAGFGSGAGSTWEGSVVIQRLDGKWVWYMDDSGLGTYYSVSSVGGSFASALAGSWSAPAPVTINGASNTSGFILQGAGVMLTNASVPVNRPRTSILGMTDGTLIGDAALLGAAALARNPKISRRNLLLPSMKP